MRNSNYPYSVNMCVVGSRKRGELPARVLAGPARRWASGARPAGLARIIVRARPPSCRSYGPSDGQVCVAHTGLANPRVIVEVGTDTYEALAEPLTRCEARRGLCRAGSAIPELRRLSEGYFTGDSSGCPEKRRYIKSLAPGIEWRRGRVPLHLLGLRGGGPRIRGRVMPYAIASDAMTRPRLVSSSRCQRRSNAVC